MIADTTSLRWDALPPLWAIVLFIVPFVFLVVRFFYKRETGRVGSKLRLAMGLLRIAAILLVLIAIWGPYTETIESEPFQRHLILAVDTSESMQTKDDYASDADLADDLRRAAGYPEERDLSELSRIRIARDLIGRDPKYLEKLAETFRLHLYTFDSAPAGRFEPREDELPADAAARLMEELPRLRAKGQLTRIGTAIRDLARAFDAKNEPVAGILLFTDGRQTGGAPYPIEEARSAAEGTREGIPIFPVAMGNPDAAVNIAVSRVDAPEVVLAGDEVAFTVHVHARGLENQPAEVVAQVVDSNERVIDSLPIEAPPFNLPPDGEKREVHFRHVFHEHGTFELRIGVPPTAREAIKGDNYQSHVLQVVKLKMRVLFVSGMPSFTYRFLSPALTRAEETISANTLLLSSESAWQQESSKGVDPIAAFPRKKSQLAPFDVIILSDVPPSDPRFAGKSEIEKEEVLSNLEQWVKQGGGLVLQAGRNEYIPYAYAHTPVAALMPVLPGKRLRQDTYLKIVQPREVKRFKLMPPTGPVHPIMRILSDPEMVRDFWDGNEYETTYLWYAPVRRAKSGAEVLAVRRDPWDSENEFYREPGTGKPHPLIALQAYGLGKVLWIGTDELWRMRKLTENLYYWRFWSGAIRHLATYRLLNGNKRIKIWLDRTDGRYHVGDSITIEVKFLDKDFEPVKPPDGERTEFTRKLKLRTPSGEEQELTVYYIDSSPPEGLFRAKWHAGAPGTYRIIAEPETGEEPAEKTFVVEKTTVELTDPLLDLRTLQGIAKESRGKVLRPSQFARLLEDDIVKRKGEVRSGETKRTDLWDRSWILWLFVALLAAEWILRRMNLLL